MSKARLEAQEDVKTEDALTRAVNKLLTMLPEPRRVLKKTARPEGRAVMIRARSAGRLIITFGRRHVGEAFSPHDFRDAALVNTEVGRSLMLEVLLADHQKFDGGRHLRCKRRRASFCHGSYPFMTARGAVGVWSPKSASTASI